MKIDIAAPHFALTEALRQHVEARFSPLDRFHGGAVSASIVLDRTNAHHHQPYVAKAHALISGEAMHVAATGDELYAVIDAAADKLAAQLRKAHERQPHIKGRHKHAEAA